MPYTAADAKGLLKAAIRDPNPVIFLENEILYGQSFDVPKLDDFVLPIGKARIHKPGKDVTIVSFGIGMTYAVKAEAELRGMGIDVEIIDLRTIRPLDLDTIIASVKKTNRLVVVEEGYPQISVGDYIANQVSQRAFDWLDAPVITIAGKDVPMPYAANLEKLALPNVGEVVEAVKAVTYRPDGEGANMPINITMPALSPTMEEGNLAKWLVKEGDKVKSGDVIAEIETDKATMEVEAVDEGTVAKIVVPAGTEGVKVNALIAVLAADGEDAGAAAKGGGAPPAKAEAAEGRSAEAPSAAEGRGAGSSGKPQPPAACCRSASASAPAAAIGDRTFASPLARRIAKDAGVDVAAVTGTGPHGRVVKADVEAAIAGGGAKAAPAAKPAPAAAPAAAPRRQGDVRRGGAEAVRAGLLRARAARQHAQDHRAPPGRGQVDDPAFLPDARLRDSTRCWRCARSSTRQRR